MKNILQNIFKNDKQEIPKPVERSFKNLFKNAASVEWINLSHEFEALFYDKGVEKIARFTPGGNLKEIRINHSPFDFDRNHLSNDYQEGTIMNYIEIHKDQATFHELIVKRGDLKRLLILLNGNFEIIQEEVL